MDTLDFCSALYLGWRHPGHSLGDWPGLSLGQPAALRAVPGSEELGRELARLQGCAQATIGSSTLHLFWDLFVILSEPDTMIFLDQASYPAIGWGVERAAGQGVPVRRFPPHAVARLAAMLASARRDGWRPVIATDGYAASLGRAAPLAHYAALAERHQGVLVVDDTQALGLFGAPAAGHGAWGSGGGGSLQAQQVFGPHIVVAASLAKAFGAPLAALAGDAAVVRRFEARSQTRSHASPPSVAAVRAAQQALRNNRACGDSRRSHVWQLLQRWWRGLAALGIASHGGPFPVQTLASNAVPASAWPDLHRYLARRGTEAVLREVGPAHGEKPGWQLSFILTANHSLAHITLALRQIGGWLHGWQLDHGSQQPFSWRQYERTAGSAAV